MSETEDASTGVGGTRPSRPQRGSEFLSTPAQVNYRLNMPVAINDLKILLKSAIIKFYSRN